MHMSPNKVPSKRERRRLRREQEQKELRIKKENRSKNKFEHERKYNIEFVGKTENQKRFLQCLYNDDLIIAKGMAGTGKSYLTMGFACRGMVERRFNNIILSRPNIPTGKSLGFFPGTVEDKLKPWLAQNLEYMKEFVNQSTAEIWLKKEDVKMVPLETMRGRSFSYSCVFVDECQNLSMEELICITTRIGEGSKLILCGDERQSDLSSSNDFKYFTEALQRNRVDRVSVVEFGIEDCLRSKLTKELLRVFEKENMYR